MPLITPLFPVVFLILGALVLGLVARIVSIKTGHILGVVVAVGSFVSCLLLYWDQPMTQTSPFWRPAPLFGVELSLRADSLSLGLVSLTAGIGVIAMLCAYASSDAMGGRSQYLGANFLVMAGAFSTILSANLVTLCLGWALLDLGLLVLTIQASDGPTASRTGLRLLGINYLAGMALLGALLFLQAHGEAFSLQATPLPTRVVSLMVLAGLLRLGVYPAFVARNSNMRMRLPSLILWHLVPVVVGGYLLARALNLTPATSLPIRELTLVLGSVSVLLSPFPLWFEKRLESMMDFVVLNQVGYMALAAALAAPYSAGIIASQTVALALALTLLFLSEVAADGPMARAHGLWKRCCVLASVAALAGTPLTIGFVARQLLYQSLVESNLAPLILLSLLANSFLVAPLLKLGLEQPAPDEDPGVMRPLVLGSMTVLAVPLVVFGLHPPLLGLVVGAQSALAAWPDLSGLVYSSATPLPSVLLAATFLSLATGYVMYRSGKVIVERAGISLETLQSVARMDWLFTAFDWSGQRAASVLELVASFFEETHSTGWILVFATLVALLLLTG
jgi:formate hydrogenlyase subunit 3/multisubunit Na+/H+ antiporter MnhD subunit